MNKIITLNKKEVCLVHGGDFHTDVDTWIEHNCSSDFPSINNTTISTRCYTVITDKTASLYNNYEGSSHILQTIGIHVGLPLVVGMAIGSVVALLRKIPSKSWV